MSRSGRQYREKSFKNHNRNKKRAWLERREDNNRRKDDWKKAA